MVFSSKKVSVLVADPTKTKVNIQKELENSKLKGIMPPIPSRLFQQPPVLEVRIFSNTNLEKYIQSVSSITRQMENRSDLNEYLI